MKLENVESQNIAAIGYIQPKQELGVSFVGSESFVYIYTKVPNNVWVAFKAANSKGQYFSANIKNTYSFRKEARQK